MRVILLSVGAIALPWLWGWVIYRVLRRVWPEVITPDHHVRHAPMTTGPAEHVDYQI